MPEYRRCPSRATYEDAFNDSKIGWPIVTIWSSPRSALIIAENHSFMAQLSRASTRRRCCIYSARCRTWIEPCFVRMSRGDTQWKSTTISRSSRPFSERSAIIMISSLIFKRGLDAFSQLQKTPLLYRYFLGVTATSERSRFVIAVSRQIIRIAEINPFDRPSFREKKVTVICLANVNVDNRTTEDCTLCCLLEYNNDIIRVSQKIDSPSWRLIFRASRNSFTSRRQIYTERIYYSFLSYKFSFQFYT